MFYGCNGGSGGNSGIDHGRCHNPGGPCCGVLVGHGGGGPCCGVLVGHGGGGGHFGCGGGGRNFHV